MVSHPRLTLDKFMVHDKLDKNRRFVNLERRSILDSALPSLRELHFEAPEGGLSRTALHGEVLRNAVSGLWGTIRQVGTGEKVRLERWHCRSFYGRYWI